MEPIPRNEYVTSLLALSGNGRAKVLCGPIGSGKSTVLSLLGSRLEQRDGRGSVFFRDMRDPGQGAVIPPSLPGAVKHVLIAEAPDSASWEVMATELMGEGMDVYVSVSDEEDIRSCIFLTEDRISRVFLRPFSRTEADRAGLVSSFLPGYPQEVLDGSWDGSAFFSDVILPELEERHPELPFLSEVFSVIGSRGAGRLRPGKIAGRIREFSAKGKEGSPDASSVMAHIDALADAYLLIPMGSRHDGGSSSHDSYGLYSAALAGDCRGGEMSEEEYFADHAWRCAFSEGCGFIREGKDSFLVLPDGRKERLVPEEDFIEWVDLWISDRCRGSFRR